MQPLTSDLVDFLLSETASTVLDDLAYADLSDPLSSITRLRKTFPLEQAAALLDQAVLRKKAVAKFPDAAHMLFVDEALQQATTQVVADYHASMFAQRGYQTVLDLGCGIGGDALAMARAGLHVIAVELDPVRARLTQVNADALGLADRIDVRCGDWTTMDLSADAAFADPARRVDAAQGRKRVFHLDQMLPPIEAIHALRLRIPDVLVKVAPGLAHEEIPVNAAVQFVAEGINLKECLLCFGGLRDDAMFRAMILPGGHSLDDTVPEGDEIISDPGAWLYEPNPAVIRAGLVRHLAVKLNAAQLDASIAYLTGDDLIQTPLARAWPVLRWGGFNLKQLNRWLREENAGHVIVKKRGSPIEPDTFRKRLKTQSGGKPVTVFLTKFDAKPGMVFCGEEQR